MRVRFLYEDRTRWVCLIIVSGKASRKQPGDNGREEIKMIPKIESKIKVKLDRNRLEILMSDTTVGFHGFMHFGTFICPVHPGEVPSPSQYFGKFSTFLIHASVAISHVCVKTTVQSFEIVRLTLTN